MKSFLKSNVAFIAAAAALAAFAAASVAPVASAHSYSGSVHLNSASAGGASTVTGGQESGVTTGPSYHLSGGVAGSFQESGVQNGASAYAGGNSASGGSWANGGADGLTGAASRGNVTAGADGGSDYGATQGFDASSSSVHWNGHH
ncbi:MAG TPA: hypothetical protein VHD37_00015 [Candidatus Paceibacterota bacterium]|nr:hypothetical protein [Candidatus Paceibacterota bacterium]